MNANVFTKHTFWEFVVPSRPGPLLIKAAELFSYKKRIREGLLVKAKPLIDVRALVCEMR